MLPSANISYPVRTMRLGELVNSGLTQRSATESSQNARNTAIENVPSRACSCRCRNDFVRWPASCVRRWRASLSVMVDASM